MIFKYIIVDTGAILFNESTTHSQVAKGFKKVYSAGFVKIVNTYADKFNILCYGKSVSLKLQSHKQDEKVIRDLFKEVSEIKYFGMSVKELYG